MLRDFKPEIKLFVIVVLIAVVVSVAGIFLFKTTQMLPVPPSPVLPQTPQQKSGFPLPTITLGYQGKTYKGVQGSHCWPVDEAGGSTLCADTTFPESLETITVKQGDELVVLLDAVRSPLTLSISTFDTGRSPAKQFSLEPELHSPWRIDHPIGTYFVLVFADWEEGDISYGFKIDVQPQTILDTSNWQTYHSDTRGTIIEELGFEVKYPEGFEFENNEKGYDLTISRGSEYSPPRYFIAVFDLR